MHKNNLILLCACNTVEKIQVLKLILDELKLLEIAVVIKKNSYYACNLLLPDPFLVVETIKQLCRQEGRERERERERERSEERRTVKRFSHHINGNN